MTEKFHYLNLMDYYARHESEAIPYKKELAFLQKNGLYCNFPYESATNPIAVESGFDEEAKLPYVIHKNKKLYFKGSYLKEDAVDVYRYYIQTEKLLGNQDGKDVPHQYQSPRVCVSEGDVLFDIGAAEGLFALDQIDKVSHVVIVESDPEWIKPLKHTFAPYENKVTIIQKFVSATDTETTISLGTLLSEFEGSSVFVKMDIEGFELASIASAELALSQREGVKMAIASYHKQNDADELKTVFDRLGYYSEFSEGFMLFYSYDTPVSPYFRHGIIRAKNFVS
jgi:hypothetical protein